MASCARGLSSQARHMHECAMQSGKWREKDGGSLGGSLGRSLYFLKGHDLY